MLRWLIFLLLYPATMGFWKHCLDPSMNGRVDCADLKVDEGKINQTDITEIQHCSFYNCPTLEVWTQTLFYNVTFHSSYGSPYFHGGALSVFASVVLQGVTFTKCSSPRHGGAIYIDRKGQLEATDTTFHENQAAHVGAVAIEGTTKFTNCHFFENRHAEVGSISTISVTAGNLTWVNGSIKESQSLWNVSGYAGLSLMSSGPSMTMLENIVIQGSTNSAIYSVGSSVIGKNVTIMNGYSSWSGACFHATGEKATIKCTQCVCRNMTMNSKYSIGGATLNLASSHIQLIDSRIQDIYSFSDTLGIGSCCLDPSSSLILNNTIYSNCTSAGSLSKGTIYSDGTLMIEHGLISSCRTIEGGGIYSTGNMVLNNVTVMDSNATVGGGIMILSDSNQVLLENVVLMNNRAAYGGGIYLKGAASFSNITIHGNTAHVLGGGAFISGYPQDIVDWQGFAHIFNNTAGENGGGLYIDNSICMTISTQSLQIQGNQALGIENKYETGLGSAIFFNQKRLKNKNLGHILYTSDGFSRIQGDIWVQDVDVAMTLKSSGLFQQWSNPNVRGSLAKIAFDPPIDTRFPLDLSGDIPDIRVQGQDAFGNIIDRMDPKRPFIVGVELIKSLDDDSYLMGESAKGMMNVSDGITFRGLSVVSNASWVKLMFYPLKLSGKGLDSIQETLLFRIDQCDHNMTKKVPLTADEWGRMQYVCLPLLQVSMGLRQGLGIIALLFAASSLTLMAVVLKYRHLQVIKATSPTMTLTTTMGCTLQLLGISSQMSQDCMVREWLELLGFTLTVGPILLKMYRLAAVYYYQKATVWLSDVYLFLGLIGMLVIVSVFLSAWQVSRPLTFQETMFPDWIQTDYCSHQQDPQGYFKLSAICIHAFLEILAVYLAYKVRKTPSKFNESKSHAFIAYNWFLLGGILYPLATYSRLTPNVSFTLDFVRTFVPSCVTLWILYLPKIHAAIRQYQTTSKSTSRHVKTSGFTDSEISKHLQSLSNIKSLPTQYTDGSMRK